jgi:hypothetical protein
MNDSHSAQRSYKAVSIGDTADHGCRVTHIVSVEANYVIYVTDDGKAGFECSRGFVSTRSQAIQCHDEIVWKCFTALPDRLRRKVLQQEAYALANAFAASDDSIAESYYRNVNRLFEAKVKEYFLFWYLLGFAATFLIGSVAILPSWHGYFANHSAEVNVAIFAGLIGALGALASVLQRIGTLEFYSYHSLWFYFISGTARAVLGYIFGLVLYFLVKADILFSVAKTNVWYILVLAFLAGINERFVPELIERTVPAPTQPERPPASTGESK